MPVLGAEGLSVAALGVGLCIGLFRGVVELFLGRFAGVEKMSLSALDIGMCLGATTMVEPPDSSTPSGLALFSPGGRRNHFIVLSLTHSWLRRC
jgi:hypothetical protein